MSGFPAPGIIWRDDVDMGDDGDEREHTNVYDPMQTHEDAEQEDGRGYYAIRGIPDYPLEEGATMMQCLEHAICYLTRCRTTLGDEYIEARRVTGANAMIRVALFSIGPRVEAGMRRGTVQGDAISIDRERFEENEWVLDEIEGRFIGGDSQPPDYHAAEDEAIHILEDWAGRNAGLPTILAYADGRHVRVVRVIKRTDDVPDYELETNACDTNGALKSDRYHLRVHDVGSERDRFGRHPEHVLFNWGVSGPTAAAGANHRQIHAIRPRIPQPDTTLNLRYRFAPASRANLDTSLDTRIAGRSLFDESRPLRIARLLPYFDSTINGESIYAEAETDKRSTPQSKLEDEVATQTAEDILAYDNTQPDDHEEAKEPFFAPSNPRDNKRTLFDYVQSEPRAQELSQIVFGGQCRMIRRPEDVLGRSTFGRHIRSEKELQNAFIDPLAMRPCSLLQIGRLSRTQSHQELPEFINLEEDILAKAFSDRNGSHAATNDQVDVERDTHSGWVVVSESDSQLRRVAHHAERPSRIIRNQGDVSGRSASNGDSHQTPSNAVVEPEPKQRARSMHFSTRSSAYPYPIHIRHEKELSGSTAVDTTSLLCCPNCKHALGTGRAGSQARTRRFSCPEDVFNSTTLGCGYPNCTRIFKAIDTKESIPLARRLSSLEKAHGHEEARHGELLHAAEGSSMVLQDDPTKDDSDSDEKYITIAVSEVTADTTDVTARRGRRHAMYSTADDSRHRLLDDEGLGVNAAFTAAVSRHEAGARRATQTLGAVARTTRSMKIASWHEVASEEEANLEHILGEEPEHVTTTQPTYHGFERTDRTLPPLDDEDHWPRLVVQMASNVRGVPPKSSTTSAMSFTRSLGPIDRWTS